MTPYYPCYMLSMHDSSRLKILADPLAISGVSYRGVGTWQGQLHTYFALLIEILTPVSS